MARLPSFDPIDFLVEKKYNLVRGGWSLPTAAQRSREDLATSEESWNSLKVQADDYRSELQQKSESEISEMVEAVRGADRGIVEHENARREALHRFNQPSAMATDAVCEYWSKAAYWSIDEATALLLGRNPGVVSKKAVLDDRSSAKFKDDFLRMFELLDRARVMAILYNSNNPQAIWEWARTSLIAVPVQLQASLEAHGFI